MDIVHLYSKIWYRWGRLSPIWSFSNSSLNTCLWEVFLLVFSYIRKLRGGQSKARAATEDVSKGPDSDFSTCLTCGFWPDFWSGDAKINKARILLSGCSESTRYRRWKRPPIIWHCPPFWIWAGFDHYSIAGTMRCQFWVQSLRTAGFQVLFLATLGHYVGSLIWGRSMGDHEAVMGGRGAQLSLVIPTKSRHLSETVCTRQTRPTAGWTLPADPVGAPRNQGLTQQALPEFLTHYMVRSNKMIILSHLAWESFATQKWITKRGTHIKRQL